MQDKINPQRIAFIGNYVPRQCGIATFTTDLCEAMVAGFPETHFLALPVNDTAEGYAYPTRVRFEIVEQEIAFYQRAADFLNIKNVDMVCLQHEYGIFGGVAGSHILALLRDLRMPVVTTLHTILNQPDPIQRLCVKFFDNARQGGRTTKLMALGPSPAFGPVGGDESARRQISAGDLQNSAGKNRYHPARYSGYSLRRSQFL